MQPSNNNNTRHRSWCFTLNNYTDIEYNSLKNLECKYLIIGKEKGEQGTLHLQGYVQFANARPLSVLKTLNQRAHWEVAKGSALQNKQYCSKENDFFEKGKIPEQGARKDIQQVYANFRKGGRVADLIKDQDLGFQALRVAEKLEAYKKLDFDKPKDVYWFWGETGTGKTRSAMDMAKLVDDYWMSGENLKWFDGYYGQPLAIIDDFRKDFCTFHFLLRLLDRYPLRVPVKGGFTEWNPEVVIITTAFPPEGVYSTREDINQLLRRIKEVKHFTEVQSTEVRGNTDPDSLDPAMQSGGYLIQETPNNSDSEEDPLN